MTTLTDRLTALGLTVAASEVTRQMALAEKLRIAYEKYRFVTQEKIADFNEKLYSRTVKLDQWGGGTYEALTFTPLSQYPSAPPADVLDALETAMGDKCFDSFEVAQITKHQIPKPDPILFGCIQGCADRFFIAQWDNDVKIEDILGENEGFFKGIKVE